MKGKGYSGVLKTLVREAISVFKDRKGKGHKHPDKRRGRL